MFIHNSISIFNTHEHELGTCMSLKPHKRQRQTLLRALSSTSGPYLDQTQGTNRHHTVNGQLWASTAIQLGV